MHDKHGRAIGEGDIVVGNSWMHGNKPKAMLVIGGSEASTSCNLTCVLAGFQSIHHTLTAKETVLAVKADGTIVDQPKEA